MAPPPRAIYFHQFFIISPGCTNLRLSFLPRSQSFRIETQCPDRKPSRVTRIFPVNFLGTVKPVNFLSRREPAL